MLLNNGLYSLTVQHLLNAFLTVQQGTADKVDVLALKTTGVEEPKILSMLIMSEAHFYRQFNSSLRTAKLENTLNDHATLLSPVQ